MPDKKLTDSEIIKALECCSQSKESSACNGCPLLEKTYCEMILMSSALDLINRLQEEKERLKGHQKDGFFNLLGNCLVFSKTLKDYNDMRKGLKAEAYKECIEKVKEKNRSVGILRQGDLDNLLKELAGDDNA